MNRKKWNIEDISAYLDDELEPKRRAAFERDIAADPRLRLRVDDMQQVVSMVRAAPLRQTPRNYLLTPSMVTEAEPQPQPRRRRVPLFGLRLATSLVALGFVVTFGLTLLQQGLTPATVLQSERSADAPMMMQAEEVEQAEAPATQPVEMKAQELEVTPEVEAGNAKEELTPDEEQAFAPVPESASPEGDGGIGGGDMPPGAGGGAPEQESEPTAETMALPLEGTPQPPEEDELLDATQAGTPTDTTPNERTGPEEETPVAEMAATGESVQEEPEADAGDDIGTALPPPTVVTPETPRLQEEPPAGGRTRLLWLSLGLGIATVVLTILTFWAARRRS